MKTYLIHGFFSQEQMMLGVAHRAESEGGIGVTVCRGILGFMFAGVIFPDQEDQGELIGEMLDFFGESELFGIELTETTLRFCKRYKKREYVIQYTFTKQHGLWAGEYTGEWTGSDIARCILTEAPEAIYLHDRALK